MKVFTFLGVLQRVVQHERRRCNDEDLLLSSVLELQRRIHSSLAGVSQLQLVFRQAHHDTLGNHMSRHGRYNEFPSVPARKKLFPGTEIKKFSVISFKT